MEFRRLAVLALFCLAVVGTNATSSSLSGEEYWHSIWPDTSMPKNLQCLVTGVNDGEIDETRYPYNSFFEDNLLPGKQMNIKFNNHYSAQPFGVWAYIKGKGNDKLTIDEICNNKISLGEDDRICVRSVESLVDFAISKLGKDIRALTSSFVPHQTLYMILEGVQKVSGEVVMCHKPNFQEPVFYCHQVNATTTYTVPMVAVDGTRTKAVAVCHHDTRGFNAHKLFHELKVMPGTMPVCHFVGTEAISWVPNKNIRLSTY